MRKLEFKLHFAEKQTKLIIFLLLLFIGNLYLESELANTFSF